MIFKRPTTSPNQYQASSLSTLVNESIGSLQLLSDIWNLTAHQLSACMSSRFECLFRPGVGWPNYFSVQLAMSHGERGDIAGKIWLVFLHV